jgi:hypothetical protein
MEDLQKFATDLEEKMELLEVLMKSSSFKDLNGASATFNGVSSVSGDEDAVLQVTAKTLQELKKEM